MEPHVNLLKKYTLYLVKILHFELVLLFYFILL